MYLQETWNSLSLLLEAISRFPVVVFTRLGLEAPRGSVLSLQ